MAALIMVIAFMRKAACGDDIFVFLVPLLVMTPAPVKVNIRESVVLVRHNDQNL